MLISTSIVKPGFRRILNKLTHVKYVSRLYRSMSTKYGAGTSVTEIYPMTVFHVFVSVLIPN